MELVRDAKSDDLPIFKKKIRNLPELHSPVYRGWVFALALTAAKAGNTLVLLWLMKKFEIEANRATPADQTDGFEVAKMYGCTTPLEAAICSKQEETPLALLALVGQDFNVNARAHNGQTVLYLAALYDMAKVAEILVRLGAQMDLPSLKDGHTPLYQAGSSGSAGLLFQ